MTRSCKRCGSGWGAAADPKAVAKAHDTHDKLSVLHPVFGRHPMFKSVGVMRLLLDAGVEVDARNEKGATPLFWVDDVDTIRFLLSNGADVNAVDTDGTTPLMVQCENSNEPFAIIALLRGGANPYVSDAVLLC
jgi:ankyrin repeat protein